MNPALFSAQMIPFALFWAVVIFIVVWAIRREKKWREDFERALLELGFEKEPAPPDARARFQVAFTDAQSLVEASHIFRRRDMKAEIWVAEWQVRHAHHRRRGRWSREWLFALQLPGVNLPRVTVHALPAHGIGSLLAKAAGLIDYPGLTRAEWPQKPTNAVVFTDNPAAAQTKLTPAVFAILAGLGWATLHAGGSTAAVDSTDFKMSRSGGKVDRTKLAHLISGITQLGAALRQ